MTRVLWGREEERAGLIPAAVLALPDLHETAYGTWFWIARVRYTGRDHEIDLYLRDQVRSLPGMLPRGELPLGQWWALLCGDAATWAAWCSADEHARDADCTVGPDDCCVACGAHHGDPCVDCGGSGFHAANCDGWKSADQA